MRGSICGNAPIVSWKDKRVAEIEADKYRAHFPDETVTVIQRKDGRFVIEVRDEDGNFVGYI